MKNAILLSLISCSILFQSCLGAKAERDSIVSSDSEGVIAEAEIQSGEDDLTKVVTVRSNRSWFAHLNDLDNPISPADTAQKVPWATLSVEKHSNLTNVTDETEIHIRFERNYTRTGVNGVLNIYSEGRIAKSIPVCQKAAVFHLRATADKLVANPDTDEIPIRIDCNTDWTIKADAGTTADIELSRYNGFDPGTVSVKFNENFSAAETQKACLTVSAEDCEDVKIEIIQNKAVPYIYIVKDTETRIISGETTASTWIRTNSAWTASVADSELENFSIVNPSGKAGIRTNQEVKVRFDYNPADPYTIRKATVRFNISGGVEPVEFTFTQRGVVFITLDNKDSFSPAIPSSNPSYDEQWYSYSYGKYTQRISLSKYIYLASQPFLYGYGSGKRPCIRFEGVEGLELKKLGVEFRRMSSSDGEGYPRNRFSGIVRTQDHIYGGTEDGRTNTPEKNLTKYVNLDWTGDKSGGTYYTYVFDLNELGKTLKPGEGCVLQYSDQSAQGAERRTSCFIKSFTLKFQ